MRRPASIFFLAVLIGGLAAAMIYRYLSEQQAALALARDQARGIAVPVVVASELIPIGTRLDAAKLKQVSWPAEAQPEGGFAEISDVVGQVARATIQKNQPITATQVTADASGLLPMLIADGMRAVSVKVDTVTGVSGFITPNSRVDVLTSGKIEGGDDKEQRSKLFMQNVRVLAIGTSIELQDDKPVEVPTVTLLVSPDEAEELALAARQGPVLLALRNFLDEERVETGGSTTRQLFGADAPRRSSGPPRRARPAPPSRPSVEVLLGEKRTRQNF
jgi:pilus assembly protein CpaB